MPTPHPCLPHRALTGTPGERRSSTFLFVKSACDVLEGFTAATGCRGSLRAGPGKGVVLGLSWRCVRLPRTPARLGDRLPDVDSKQRTSARGLEGMDIFGVMAKRTATARRGAFVLDS
eukprot:365442-Chlamydomonas_euryale.AAC.10